MYLILHYIHITHQTFIPNQNRPFKNKQIFNHSTASPNTSLRLRGLAQARQSCLDKSPFRLGEGLTGTRKQRGISLKRDPSRLGELCARSKHTGRLSDHSRRKLWASLCTSRLGESSSPRRVYQCLPLFAPATRIHAPNRGSSQNQTFIAMHNLKEFTNHDNTS